MPTKDPKALLQRLLIEPTECEWLEFKQNNADIDRIGRSVSACANSAMLADRDKAFIVWGIEDRTKKRLGTTVRLHELKKGNVNLQNWLSQVIEPKLMMECLDFEDNGKHFSILVIEPSYDRPVRFSGSEYIRIGENVKSIGDYKEHERSLWLATGRRKFESAVALTHQIGAEVISKLDLETYYRLRGEPVPKNQTELLRKYVQLGALRENMEGSFDITNLGAILFAQDIGHFPSIASKAVRVIKYSGLDKSTSEEEVSGQMGYAVRFPQMLQFVMEKLPTEEIYEKGVRKKVNKYSEVAIREIVANALIHQDLTITGAGPMIEIYQDRVEVTNPGNSLIDVDRIIDDRRSRNERFAQVMRDMGLCEERGGGIDRAIIDTEEKFLPAPEFLSSENAMRVVIFGPRRFGELSKADRVRACFCHCVVRWLRHNYMNNTSLRERFSLSEDDYQAVSAVIAYAKKEKRIKAADPAQGNKYAKYVPYWAQ